jgi:hypothetical protein
MENLSRMPVDRDLFYFALLGSISSSPVLTS